MNRRERRRARVTHQKLLRSNNEKHTRASMMPGERSEEHRTLFDKVFHKKSGGVSVKCQGIYESVFCKG